VDVLTNEYMFDLGTAVSDWKSIAHRTGASLFQKEQQSPFAWLILGNRQKVMKTCVAKA
jgi:hypothetical protein